MSDCCRKNSRYNCIFCCPYVWFCWHAIKSTINAPESVQNRPQCPLRLSHVNYTVCKAAALWTSCGSPRALVWTSTIMKPEWSRENCRLWSWTTSEPRELAPWSMDEARVKRWRTGENPIRDQLRDGGLMGWGFEPRHTWSVKKTRQERH